MAESFGEGDSGRKWRRRVGSWAAGGFTTIPNTSPRQVKGIRPSLTLSINLVLIASFLLPREIHQAGFSLETLFVGFYMILRDEFTTFMTKSITAHIQHSG